MLNVLKEKAIAQALGLLQSTAVTKMMESEKVGVLLEKAMSLPIRISEGAHVQRERFTTLLELATREDLDDVKRSVARMEDLLRELKDQSVDLLNKANEKDPDSGNVAQ